MDIFPFIRIEGAEVGLIRFRGPWSLRRGRLPGGGMYAVRRGACWFEMDEPARTFRLEAGDALGIAKHHPHTLRNSLFTKLPVGETALELLPLDAEEEPSGDDVTELLVFWSTGTHPLEDVLPPMSLIRGDGSRHAKVIASVIDLLSLELAGGGRAGSPAVVYRLGEIIVIEMLRALMSQELDRNPAWLAALGDASIMRAVAAMHERPGDSWTLQRLAKLAGLSRSAFVARFRRVVGDAPMQHLLQTRMQRAGLALLEGRHALGAIAESVGYESESAFHRAFRRVYGVTPGDWRSARRSSAASDAAARALD